MKCEICKNKIAETFLKKPLGTFIKDNKGKQHIICKNCQSTLDNDKEKILAELPL